MGGPLVTRHVERLEQGRLVAMEDVAIWEQQRGERLVLGGGGDVPLGSQVSHKGFDLRPAHVVGVTFAVEENEALI